MGSSCKYTPPQAEAVIAKFYESLNERDRRRSAGIEAFKLGIRGTPYLFIVDYKLQLSYERLWQE